MKQIREDIDDHKEIALSDDQVLQMVDGKAKVLIYRDLRKYNTLDEAMGPHKAIFLLYETEPDYGHWTLVFRQSPDTVEFFDPYGVFLDDELSWVKLNTRRMLGQNVPYLSRLFYYSRYPNLIYNNYKFQKMGEGINTCGRWCVLRLVCRDYSLEEFKNAFLHKKGDDIATILTSF